MCNLMIGQCTFHTASPNIYNNDITTSERFETCCISAVVLTPTSDILEIMHDPGCLFFSDTGNKPMVMEIIHEY